MVRWETMERIWIPIKFEGNVSRQTAWHYDRQKWPVLKSLVLRFPWGQWLVVVWIQYHIWSCSAVSKRWDSMIANTSLGLSVKKRMKSLQYTPAVRGYSVAHKWCLGRRRTSTLGTRQALGKAYAGEWVLLEELCGVLWSWAVSHGNPWALVAYMSMLVWCRGWNQSCLFLVQLSFVFACCSRLEQLESETNKDLVWRIETSKLSFFASI